MTSITTFNQCVPGCVMAAKDLALSALPRAGAICRAGAFAGLPLALMCGCSGVDVTPESTDRFEKANYKLYAWRSEAPSQTSFTRDLTTVKSPSIRRSFEERMSDLGYQLVDRHEAEFFVEYFAATGFRDGQLAQGGSNEILYGSSVNREIDGASADNAQELSYSLQTSDIQLLFIDAVSSSLLWRVNVSMVVEDANRIDEDQVQHAVRQGLSLLPAAPESAVH